MPSRRWPPLRVASECWGLHHSARTTVAQSSPSRIRASASMRPMPTASSMRSLRPSRAAWGWVCRSAHRLSRLMAAASGRRRRCRTAPPSISNCRQRAGRKPIRIRTRSLTPAENRYRSISGASATTAGKHRPKFLDNGRSGRGKSKRFRRLFCGGDQRDRTYCRSAIMTPEPSTVLVVDDDPSVREALSDLFQSVGLRVEVFASTQEFLKNNRPQGPSCLVLDVRLPGKSGLDFQQELNAADMSLPIVFLTGHGDIPMSVRAMKAGAVEFLTKPFREQDLLDAVQTALERDRLNREDEKLLGTLRQHYAALTPREQTILTLVVAGRRNKQIAFEVGTSEVTVKVHRTNLMRKMQASSLADLITMATKLGIPEKSPATLTRTSHL